MQPTSSSGKRRLRAVVVGLWLLAGAGAAVSIYQFSMSSSAAKSRVAKESSSGGLQPPEPPPRGREARALLRHVAVAEPEALTEVRQAPARALSPRESAAERGRKAELRIAELTQSVRQEPRDSRWARAMESTIRDALVEVQTSNRVHFDVQCGSSRCVAEANISTRSEFDALLERLRSIPDLGHSTVRRTNLENGEFKLRAVLARPGFTPEGEPLG